MTNTLAHNWHLQRGSGHWIPFPPEDSARLEQAHLASLEQAGVQCLVLVDGGRRRVDLAARELSTVYWSSEPCAVRRCLWFWAKDKAAKALVPYTEDESDRVEVLVASGATNTALALSDGVHEIINHSHAPDARVPTSPHDALAGPHQHRRDGAGTVRRVVRGSPAQRHEAATAGRDGDAPARHLVLVVHGIGEYLFSKGGVSASDSTVGSFGEDIGHVGSTEELRAQASALLSLPAGVRTAGAEAIPLGRVEFLPVLWAKSVRPPAMVERLNQASYEARRLSDDASAR